MNQSTPESNGFTLLEILMAISIFAIVISLAYGSYRATFRIIDSTEAQTEIHTKAGMAMDRISSDLNSLYLGTNGFLQGKSKSIGTRKADTILFTSTAHLVLNRNEQAAGYATIRYSVDEDPDTGELLLFRLDKAFRPTETDEPESEKGLLLCNGLQEVHFIYHQAQGEQLDNWDSKEIEKTDTHAPKLPDRIEINLLFTNPNETAQPIQFTTAVTFPGTVPAGETP